MGTRSSQKSQPCRRTHVPSLPTSGRTYVRHGLDAMFIQNVANDRVVLEATVTLQPA
ncbi:uncharacterized protein [Drosophila bipectinata]|uniref:uncharacterized protein isoform X2 n=1 Tax=Drosophila bipectinata TaxID=42026 RepID=UPI001C8A67E2|nr:uncharacterized protein LOC108125593 isoform X2 [Drosophila bipectinata]